MSSIDQPRFATPLLASSFPKTFLIAVATIAVLTAMVVGVIEWAQADARSAARDARREAQGMENANRACLPSKPSAIKHYGPGWSHRPYWRVTCPDGSVQLITAYPKETR